jgi:hypothetical protein
MLLSSISEECWNLLWLEKGVTGRDGVEWLARAVDNSSHMYNPNRLPDVTLSVPTWLPDYARGCLLRLMCVRTEPDISQTILHRTSLDAPIEDVVVLITFVDEEISEELAKKSSPACHRSAVHECS